jgi:hypothetical protein
MVKNNVLKGVFLVGLGATTYGMLATFVKKWHILKIIQQQEQLYYTRNHRNIVYDYFKKKKIKIQLKASSRIFQLCSWNFFLGMTSVFYYLAVKYIPVYRNRAIDANRLDGSFIRNGLENHHRNKKVLQYLLF